ncbi:MFS transporter [Streptoalloteichus hindustanus]|uniref:Drug resistance transporter, EmrB/QacA subfamily n=1 Tax=Streptoalloteichus hindustanus TaxID=2017 RepID=A0A1M4ZBN9_STRHI|nr:MFS transporter [Streptoalloteichus hindustanus]SHF15378.1 drug resistance transporter, EmrB/QacA subfamily [Streptoalloteichus hindustanus]
MGHHDTENLTENGAENGTAPGGARETPALRSPSRAVLVLACASQFMVVLDASVVNVALPSLQVELGFDATDLQWVVNGYALALACFLLLGGRLTDLHGRRRALGLGLALFTAASLVGGLATSAGVLVVARVVQGLGAAILVPTTLTVLTTTFPEGPERTRAVATWSAVSLAGGTAGNLVGGLLTQFLSWRGVLLVNVPLGVVALVLAARVLPADHGHRSARRLDLPGAALVTAGLAAITYGITRTHDHGWGDPLTALTLAGGVCALAVFVVTQARFTRTPLVPLHLFRVRAVSVGNVAMLLAGAGLIPMWYFLTLFMQRELHYGPLWTGMGFLPHTLLSMLVGTRVTPRLMRRFSTRHLVVVGAVLAAAGFLWQSRVGSDTGYLWGVLGPAVVISLGGGLLNTPLTTAVTSGVDTSDAGAAAGLMTTTKQIGSALGLAVLVTIGQSSETAVDHGRVFLATAATLVATALVALGLPRRRSSLTLRATRHRERSR